MNSLEVGIVVGGVGSRERRGAATLRKRSYVRRGLVEGE